MKTCKKILVMKMNKFFKFVGAVATPVVSELPFFTLFLLSISVQPLRWIPRNVLYGRLDRVFELVFDNIPRAAVVAYIFTLLVYYTRSKAVKIGGYAFASVLLVVCVFLLLVFGKTLQPDIIILLAETNARESSEFLSSFILTPGGVIALLCLTAYVAAAFFLENRRMRLASWGGAEVPPHHGHPVVRCPLCGTGAFHVSH